MKEERTKVSVTSNGIQIRNIIDISFCNKQKKGSDFDSDKAKERGLNMMLDIIGAFSPRLIASIKRRINACRTNLLNHLNNIEYCDEMGHICYRRDDGTVGNFNTRSFEAMDDCVKALEHSRFLEFVQNKLWIDQMLKALLNDPEQDHLDCNGFKYSQLISILCELQACPPEYLPE